MKTSWRASPSAGAPSLLEQLELSAEEFDHRTRGSPLRRAKHSGYVRNAAVAAGNVGGQEAMRPLRQLAENGDPIIREHAAWALTHIADAEYQRCVDYWWLPEIRAS